MDNLQYTSAPVLRILVRSILGALSLTNVCFLLANISIGNQVVQTGAILFGIITTLLFWGDVKGKIEVDRRIPLLILFFMCATGAFFYDISPAPVYIFIPSLVCSLVVLHRRSSTRASLFIHVLATLVCYTQTTGKAEMDILPVIVFVGTLVVIFAASILAITSNRNYYHEIANLQTVLKMKSYSNASKSRMLQTQNEELNASQAQLQSRIEENSVRLQHLSSVNRELELIAKAASSDMKEPLRVIRTESQALGQRLGELKLKDDFAEYLTFISDGASRMNAMVDDLLQYCNPSMKLPSATVSTAEILQIIESNLTNLLLRENASLIVQPGMPDIIGHKTEVLQLFQNLITNGVKFRKPDVLPTCKVGFTKCEDEYCFHVSDNGIGIPANRVDDVFGLFTRLHGRGSYEGTGIGLALSRRIVLAAGGRIWAESTEGEGTTFYFTWPVHKKKKDTSIAQTLLHSVT